MGGDAASFNGTVLVGESPGEATQALIGAAAGLTGYSITTAGTNSIIFTRRYTPTWAIVLAIVGALFVLIGLLFLLVKTTDSLAVSLTPQDGGTRIVISGVATGQLSARINSALGAMKPLSEGGVGEASTSSTPSES